MRKAHFLAALGRRAICMDKKREMEYSKRCINETELPLGFVLHVGSKVPCNGGIPLAALAISQPP